MRALSGLLDQVDQAGGFVGRGRTDQALEFGVGQLLFEIADHVKCLPPAVEDLEAGALIVAADAAVIEAYRMPQAGAAALPIIKGGWLSAHIAKRYIAGARPSGRPRLLVYKGYPLRLPLGAFQILRFGKIGEDLHGCLHLLVAQFKIGQLAGKILLVSGQIQQAMA